MAAFARICSMLSMERTTKDSAVEIYETFEERYNAAWPESTLAASAVIIAIYRHQDSCGNAYATNDIFDLANVSPREGIPFLLTTDTLIPEFDPDSPFHNDIVQIKRRYVADTLLVAKLVELWRCITSEISIYSGALVELSWVLFLFCRERQPSTIYRQVQLVAATVYAITETFGDEAMKDVVSPVSSSIGIMKPKSLESSQEQILNKLNALDISIVRQFFKRNNVPTRSDKDISTALRILMAAYKEMLANIAMEFGKSPFYFQHLGSLAEHYASWLRQTHRTALLASTHIKFDQSNLNSFTDSLEDWFPVSASVTKSTTTVCDKRMRQETCSSTTVEHVDNKRTKFNVSSQSTGASSGNASYNVDSQPFHSRPSPAMTTSSPGWWWANSASPGRYVRETLQSGRDTNLNDPSGSINTNKTYLPENYGIKKLSTSPVGESMEALAWIMKSVHPLPLRPSDSFIFVCDQLVDSFVKQNSAVKLASPHAGDNECHGKFDPKEVATSDSDARYEAISYMVKTMEDILNDCRSQFSACATSSEEHICSNAVTNNPPLLESPAAAVASAASRSTLSTSEQNKQQVEPKDQTKHVPVSRPRRASAGSDRSLLSESEITGDGCGLLRSLCDAAQKLFYLLYPKMLQNELGTVHHPERFDLVAKLLLNRTFVASIYATCTNLVAYASAIDTFSIPSLLHSLDLDPFEYWKTLEPLLRSHDLFPLSIQRRIAWLEEQILERYIWHQNSGIFRSLRTAIDRFSQTHSDTLECRSSHAASSVANVSEKVDECNDNDIETRLRRHIRHVKLPASVALALRKTIRIIASRIQYYCEYLRLQERLVQARQIALHFHPSHGNIPVYDQRSQNESAGIIPIHDMVWTITIRLFTRVDRLRQFMQMGRVQQQSPHKQDNHSEADKHLSNFGQYYLEECRSIDQLVMCALYGVCKVTGVQIRFADIIEAYADLYQDPHLISSTVYDIPVADHPVTTPHSDSSTSQDESDLPRVPSGQFEDARERAYVSSSAAEIQNCSSMIVHRQNVSGWSDTKTQTQQEYCVRHRNIVALYNNEFVPLVKRHLISLHRRVLRGVRNAVNCNETSFPMLLTLPKTRVSSLPTSISGESEPQRLRGGPDNVYVSCTRTCNWPHEQHDDLDYPYVASSHFSEEDYESITSDLGVVEGLLALGSATEGALLSDDPTPRPRTKRKRVPSRKIREAEFNHLDDSDMRTVGMNLLELAKGSPQPKAENKTNFNKHTPKCMQILSQKSMSPFSIYPTIRYAFGNDPVRNSVNVKLMNASMVHS